MSDPFESLLKKYANLLSLLDQVFEQQLQLKNASCEKICKWIETISLFLTLSKRKVFIFARRVDVYDFDETTKANGYRSMVNIFEKIIDDLWICVSKLEKDPCPSFYLHQPHIKRIKCWCRFIIAFYPIFCATAKLSESNQNELFSMKDNPICKILIENSSSFVHEAFYGPLFGFQFNPKLAKILDLLITSLAAYALGFESSSYKIIQTAIAFGQNSYLFLNTKKRALKLKELYSAPSIEFYKSLMSLTDDLGIQYIPALLGPNLQVCRQIKLKVVELDLQARDDDNRFIKLFNESSHSRLILNNEVNVVCLCLNHHEGQDKIFSTAFTSLFDSKPTAENLVVFIHGGGFVGLSANDYQMILREWATSLECPIIAIDYTLSPEAIFPQAVEECFFAYCWILKNYAKFGSKLEKIILVGDSAGGNLLLSVTQRAITEGIRIPDGLVPIYPCCMMVDSFSPSRLFCVIDSFLSSGFLLACKKAYFGYPSRLQSCPLLDKKKEKKISRSASVINHETMPIMAFHKILDMDESALKYYQLDDKIDMYDNLEMIQIYEDNDSQIDLYDNLPLNPLASSLLASDDVLKQFPTVRIMVIDTDPLLDDGIEFAKKLAKNNVNVKVDVFSDLPHGFLQISAAMSETRVCADIILCRLKELLFS